MSINQVGISPDIQEKLRRIRLLALDLDGVLTDGGVFVSEEGKEFRRYDIKDGLGLVNVMKAGIDVVIISSSSNQAINHRANSLGITKIFTQVKLKLETLKEVCKQAQIPFDDICYMGDDLADLEVMKKVGLALLSVRCGFRYSTNIFVYDTSPRWAWGSA